MEQVAADAHPPVTQLQPDGAASSGARLALTDDLLAGRFFSIDVRGQVTGWNPRAEAAFGWSTHHVSGMSLFDTLLVPGVGFGPDDLEEFFVAAAGGAGRHVRATAQHQEGSHLPVELSIVPIQLAEAYELNAFLQDVSTSTASGVASEIGRVRAEHAAVLKMISNSLEEAFTAHDGEQRLAGALIIFHIEAAMTVAPPAGAASDSAPSGPAVGTSVAEDAGVARAEAERVRLQIEEALTAAEEARAEAEAARAQRDELQSRLDSAEAGAPDVEAAQRAAEDARREAEEARRDAERLRGELDGLRAAADGSQQSAEANAAELGQARAELAQATADSERLAGELESARAELAAASAERDALRTEAEELRVKIESAQQRAEEIAADAAAAREGGEEAEVALASAREEARAAHTELAEVRSRAEALETDLAGARARADDSQARADDTQARADAAREEATAAQAEVEAARAEARAAQTELEAARSELAGAREEVTAVRAEIEAVQAQAESAGKTVGDAQAELGEARSDAVKARAEADKATTDAEAARADAEAARADAEAARAGAEAARADAEAARAEAEEARARAEEASALAETARAEPTTDPVFERAFEGAAIGMAIKQDGRFTRVNRALCELTGRDADVLLKIDPVELVHADERGAHAATEKSILSGDAASSNAEARLIHATGDEVTVRESASVLDDGKLLLQFELTEADAHTAVEDHDPVTGLFNRRRFEEELSRHVAEAAKHGDRGAALMLDLANTSELDAAQGEELLKTVAEALKQNIDESEVLAHLGGDEFAVLLPHADAAHARKIAQNIAEAVGPEVLKIGDQSVRVTIDVGVALFDERRHPAAAEAPAPAPAEAPPAADHLPAAIAPSTALAPADGIAERIRKALADDSFALYAQPIIDLRTSEITQYELLIRMHDESGRLMLPDKFLPDAQQAGLMPAIDQWVIRHAIGLIKDAAEDGRRLLLEVNISSDSIDDPALPALIESELDATGIDPHLLVIEITENAALNKIEDTIKLSKWIRSMGCRFALDDFGSTFATVKYLKDMPVDYFKLDGDLIVTLPESRTNQLLLNALMDVARGTGTQTIAVYVPDDETLVMLRQFGIGYGQGNRVGRPRPVGEI